mgnify:FL=1
MSAVEEGKPLTTDGLFQLVCDEVFLDGVVEEFENKILQVLARFLGIMPERALEMAAEAKKRFEAGQFKEKRPLAPNAVYEKALYFICSDGEIDDDERRMLDGLRKLFKISDKFHQDLMNKMKDKFVPEEELDPEKLISPVLERVVNSLEMKEWNKCVRGFRDYRRLARRLALSAHLPQYLSGLAKLVETSAAISDPYNRQKTMNDAISIVETFGEKQLHNSAAAAHFAEACRQLLFVFIKHNDRESAGNLLRWQIEPVKRFGADSKIERAVTALILDYQRLIFDSGDDPRASAAESPLVSLLKTLLEIYPQSESVEHVVSRFSDLTGQDLASL